MRELLKEFMLNEEQQRVFLTILYNFILLDKEIADEEELLLTVIKNEFFKLDDFEKVQLEFGQLIEECKKLSDNYAIIYLFKALYQICALSKDPASGKQRLYEVLNEIPFKNNFIKERIVQEVFERQGGILEDLKDNISEVIGKFKKDNIEEVIGKFKTLFKKEGKDES